MKGTAITTSHSITTDRATSRGLKQRGRHAETPEERRARLKLIREGKPR